MISASAFVGAEALVCISAPGIVMRLSPQWIEAAAALTVAYLAFEMILLPQSGSRALVIGVLGLFHGMYFSQFVTSAKYQVAPFLMGVIIGELALLCAFASLRRVLVKYLHIPRAVPVTASHLWLAD